MIVRPPISLSAVALALLSATLSSAQTYTSCNPLYGTCPAEPALGGSMSADFTQGPSSFFTAIGSADKISYSSAGAQFQVAASGNAPTIASNFYIMFGRVDVTMLAAPGTGIVSSVVLQSADLDEIDWEWLGGDTTAVQSNYFGKGNTATYDRASFISVEAPQSVMHTYTVEWTSASITWSVDGVAQRVLTYAQSSGGGSYYPQTPMQIKIGAWAGGDPSNAAGTIQWAGGYTDYSQGPFNMIVKSIAVQDYSTGTSYSYGDTSGSYGSIVSNGGKIGVGVTSGSGTVVAPAQSSLTNIPISNGLPSSYTTQTYDRGSYTQPASASQYWAGTGYRVSSASTSTTTPYIPPYSSDMSSMESSSYTYAQVTPSPSPSPSPLPVIPSSSIPIPVAVSSTVPIPMTTGKTVYPTEVTSIIYASETVKTSSTDISDVEAATTTTIPSVVSSGPQSSFHSVSSYSAPSSFRVVTSSSSTTSLPIATRVSNSANSYRKGINGGSGWNLCLSMCIAWVFAMGMGVLIL